MRDLHLSGERADKPLLYRRTTGPQLWAAGLILLGGLGLIVLGGCFLIGVMMLLVGEFFWGPSLVTWTPATYLLLFMLFVLAAACFVVAAVIVPSGFRGLFRFDERVVAGRFSTC